MKPLGIQLDIFLSNWKLLFAILRQITIVQLLCAYSKCIIRRTLKILIAKDEILVKVYGFCLNHYKIQKYC